MLKRFHNGKALPCKLCSCSGAAIKKITRKKTKITPRICGICGQAHLKATVEALENIYENINEKLKITKKAKLLRQIGLNIEIIDSHIKWFYMFIMPDIIKLDTNDLGIYTPLKGF